MCFKLWDCLVAETKDPTTCKSEKQETLKQ